MVPLPLLRTVPNSSPTLIPGRILVIRLRLIIGDLGWALWRARAATGTNPCVHIVLLRLWPSPASVLPHATNGSVAYTVPHWHGRHWLGVARRQRFHYWQTARIHRRHWVNLTSKMCILITRSWLQTNTGSKYPLFIINTNITTGKVFFIVHHS